MLPSEPLLSGPRGLPTGGTCAWGHELGESVYRASLFRFAGGHEGLRVSTVDPS
jgi:hypothetical protein